MIAAGCAPLRQKKPKNRHLGFGKPAAKSCNSEIKEL
jgi:hypothetical protein